MENNVREKNGSKGVVVILCILLLISIGFICYDKLLKKEETKPADCNCPTCEKCDKETSEDEESVACNLDMNGKTSLNVLEECANKGASNNNVVIKNVKVNGKTYVLKYIFDEDERSTDSQLAYNNGVTRIYVDGKLLDAFPGKYRNCLMTIKISNNKLVLEEAYPSEDPSFEHTYDLKDLDE